MSFRFATDQGTLSMPYLIRSLFCCLLLILMLPFQRLTAQEVVPFGDAKPTVSRIVTDELKTESEPDPAATNPATAPAIKEEPSKPTLAELMARFAEIESSYLPFHVEVIETLGLRTGVSDFGADRESVQEGYQRRSFAVRNAKSWMMESTRVTRGRFDSTVRVISQDGRVILREGHAGSDSDLQQMFAQALRPFASVFPLLSHPEHPVLLSDLYKSNPECFRMMAQGDMVQLLVEPKTGNREGGRIELWLSKEHDWHPIRMLRYTNSSDTVFDEECAVTTLQRLESDIRISAGRLGSLWSRSENSSDRKTPQFIVTDFELSASAYGEQVAETIFSADTPPGQSPLKKSGRATDPHSYFFIPSTITEPTSGPMSLNSVAKALESTSEERMHTAAESKVDGNSSASGTPIAEYRRRLANLETPVLQLAEKVRSTETTFGKDHPNAVKQRAELRGLVQKTFAERQEIQRAELAEFARRLEHMQRSIETREKIADEIVDRRVELLLNPDVVWGDSISTASPPKSSDDIGRPEATSDLEEVPPFHSLEPFSIDRPLEERPSVPRSVPENRAQLGYYMSALVRDVDEFEDRTPLKLLMEFKDQPVLQITDDFKAAVSSLREQVNLDAPRAKLEECFAPVSQHGTAFVQAWSNVKSQPAKVVLNEIADDIVSLERCIASLDQSERDGAKLNPAPEPLAVKRNVAELEADKETISLTLFEVTDAKFMISDDSNVRQTAAPADLDDQLANMLINKTAKLIGKHTIETTGDQLATLHSGGKFEVPSSSSERKEERVYGTTIEITPRTLNGERVFQIVWNERVRNFENAVSGIPGIDEKRIQLDVTSPLPGSPGYLIGPAKGKNQTRRLFVHFVLNSASSADRPVSRRDPSTETQFNDPNAASRSNLQGVTGEATADHSFFREESPPKSDAEKSVGRLVLVFADDAARRMVPALMVKHGERTLALTVGPATIVPDNTPHAIDRTFLEFYNRDDVPVEYSTEFEFPDLRMYLAKESVSAFQLENSATVELSDHLSAIINHGQADFKVTPRAARVTALEQSTTWELPSHNVTREFSGLIQIDQRLPEGTPLFKNGELAGITLLGTRFLKDDVPGSYVVPASRIFEVLQKLKLE